MMAHLWAMKITRMTSAIALAAVVSMPQGANAQAYELAVEAEVLEGWRAPDGRHIAAVRFRLKDGWKTYWRSPGDGGIPPRFNWAGSRNLRALDVMWPTPEVFSQGGMTSLGYEHEVVVPVMIEPRRAGKDIVLNGELEIGVCKDICVPETLKVSARLPGESAQIDPEISVALVDQPYSEKEAGVQTVSCKMSPSQDGMKVEARIQMPSSGGREFSVVETDNPLLWVSEAKTQRSGNTLHVSSEIMHVDSEAFLLNRSSLRITVFGGNYAVDIQGCSAS